MIDQIYDRGYQSGRSDLHRGVDRLFRAIRDAVAPAMSVLHHLEWDAPWQAAGKRKP